MRVEAPQGYFNGRRCKAGIIPDSVLIFIRTDGQDLNNHPPRNFHHRNLLLLPLRGSGRIIVDEKTYALHPGLALFVRPYQFHHYSGMETEPILWVFVTFEGFSGDVPYPSLCEIRERYLWEDILRLLESYSDWHRAASGRALALRLALIIDGLWRHAVRDQQVQSEPDVGEAEQIILQVRSILLQDLSRPLRIADVARKMGYSASRLRAHFRQATGFSIGRFQRRIRMQHAAQLLTRMGMSVGEVASACGWDSSFSFSRAFKQYWGRPPKSFKPGRSS